MTELDLGGRQRVHVVGVGGAGMSGIATILATMGHTVSGSDRTDSPVLRRLAERGIVVGAGHAAAHVAGAELVTASSAVPASNPELVEAARLGIPVVRRAGVLAAICATRRTVAVAGTKGKTTTTAMLAAVLEAAGWNPSFLVGGDVPSAGGGARWVEDSEWMVVEADESDGSFLALPAEAVVVTNVEADHLDFYGSLAALEAAFADFVHQAPGARVVGIDSTASAALAAVEGTAVRTSGTGAGADVRAAELTAGRDRAGFVLEVDGQAVGTVELGVPGAHNVRNACAALALGLTLGVPFATAAAALAGYRPVARRFERRGTLGGVSFVDDYAHLPSAIRVVVETARAGGAERVVAVFQPHLYSRTAALAAELGAALAAADVVVVTDVYAAREEPLPGVTGELVAAGVRAARPDLELHYVARRQDVAATVAAVVRPGDVCLTLGAGDITTLAGELGVTGPET